jgi:hypothetical protein
VRGDQNATLIHADVHVRGLEPGKHYMVLRYVAGLRIRLAPTLWG